MTDAQQGTLPLAAIHPDQGNIRSELGDVTDLVASIRANGILQPLLVRRSGSTYVLLDGHRRHAAARLAGLHEAPVIVAADRAAHAKTATMLAAALHAALTPLEQARAFKHLRDIEGMSTVQIAKATGYGTGTIRDRLVLLDLPAPAQQLVADKTLSLTSATDLARQAKTTGHGSVPANQRRTAYLTGAHPLAQAARDQCSEVHRTHRSLVGGIACGQCWEAAIRADERSQP